MIGVEWLFAAALLALGAGFGIGLQAGRRSGKGQARITELEGELQSARQELENYRGEVVAQFSDTARKFRTLNDAYSQLHRQLAESANLLCGTAAGPMLEAPAGAEEREIVAADTDTDTDTDTRTEAGSGSDDAEASPEDIVVEEPQPTAAPPAGAPSTGAPFTGAPFTGAENAEAERAERDRDERKTAAGA